MNMNIGGMSLPMRNSTTTTSVNEEVVPQSTRSIEIIIITAVVFVIFGIICFASQSIGRPYPFDEEQGASAGRVTAYDKSARIEFIKSHLPSRTIKELIAEGGNEEEQQDVDEESGCVAIKPTTTPSVIPSRENTQENILATNETIAPTAPTTSLVLSFQEAFVTSKSGGREECSICLASYHSHDDVAWSTNPACPHEYHRACIEAWLVLHEECPLCRCIFLLQTPTPVKASPGPMPSQHSSQAQEPQHSWRA